MKRLPSKLPKVNLYQDAFGKWRSSSIKPKHFNLIQEKLTINQAAKLVVDKNLEYTVSFDDMPYELLSADEG